MSGETDWYDASTKKLPPLPSFAAPDDDFFASAEEPGQCPGRFLLRAELSAIACPSPAQVTELHQSINFAQLSPDGKIPASCQGYICSLAQDGGTPQVFAAVFSTQSGRTWVYSPEVQPVTPQEHADTIAAAIGFAEQVGFLMEPVQFGPDRRHQVEAVLRCPVLQCAVQ